MLGQLAEEPNRADVVVGDAEVVETAASASVATDDDGAPIGGDVRGRATAQLHARTEMINTRCARRITGCSRLDHPRMDVCRSARCL
jgi:hypothetical protein